MTSQGLNDGPSQTCSWAGQGRQHPSVRRLLGGGWSSVPEQGWVPRTGEPSPVCVHGVAGSPHLLARLFLGAQAALLLSVICV